MPDVIVIGGGVAGMTAALGVQKLGGDVTVVEAQVTASWRIGETLAAEARPVLQELGLWDEHRQSSHLPSYGNVSCWGWEAPVDKDFTCNPCGHAWQLDRALFEATLARAAARRGVRMTCGEAVTGLTRVDDQWHVQVGAETLQAPWIIDATGRRAFVARHLGVARRSLDSLVAVYATARSKAGSDRDGRTHVEAVPEGWCYTALTPGGRRTVSFQTDADLLPSDQQWRSCEWFSTHLGQARHISALLARHGYSFDHAPELTSAHTGRLDQFSGPGWVAIGDAAMSFDPVTGQGLFKAMRSAMQVAQLIVSGSAADRVAFDSWNEQLWQQFRRAQRDCYAQERRWPTAPFWQSRN